MSHKYEVYHIADSRFETFQIRIKNLQNNIEYCYCTVYREQDIVRILIHFLDYDASGYSIVVNNLSTDRTDPTESLRLANFRFSAYLEEILIQYLSSKCSSLSKERLEIVSVPDLLEGL